MWFGYDIQNTCGFHLGFHWVSKLMHVTNLAIFIGYQTYELLMSLRSNISSTRDSVSSGYPNTEKRVENMTRSRVFLTKFVMFG